MGRSTTGVVVDGPGPLAAECAEQLRRCGVPVRAGALAADAAETASRAGEPPPRLVVLVPGGRVPPWAGAPWHARGVAHLPVETQGVVTVGPLVLPGRTACLTCVGPARTRPGTLSGHVPTTPPVDPAALVLGAAVVAVTALGVLHGDESLAGISTEIGPGASTVTHRFWHVGPDCRCASVTMSA